MVLSFQQLQWTRMSPALMIRVLRRRRTRSRRRQQGNQSRNCSTFLEGYTTYYSAVCGSHCAKFEWRWYETDGWRWKSDHRHLVYEADLWSLLKLVISHNLEKIYNQERITLWVLYLLHRCSLCGEMYRILACRVTPALKLSRASVFVSRFRSHGLVSSKSTPLRVCAFETDRATGNHTSFICADHIAKPQKNFKYCIHHTPQLYTIHPNTWDRY